MPPARPEGTLRASPPKQTSLPVSQQGSAKQKAAQSASVQSRGAMARKLCRDLCRLSPSLSHQRTQQPHDSTFPWETGLKIGRLGDVWETAARTELCSASGWLILSAGITELQGPAKSIQPAVSRDCRAPAGSPGRRRDPHRPVKTPTTVHSGTRAPTSPLRWAQHGGRSSPVSI